MKALGAVLAFDRLPSLLSLNLSDNPLGPSGLKVFAEGLSSSPQSLPLRTLKVARTKAKAEGVGALAEALKAKKMSSLQTLNLEGNDMRPAGVKHLASTVNSDAVPHLRVLILKENFLTHVTQEERDGAPLAELLSTSALKELEALDLSGNCAFDLELGGEGGGNVASAGALAVSGRFPKLRRVYLGGGDRFWGCTMHSGQLAAFAVGLGVAGTPSVEELVLARGGSVENPNDSEGVVALATALSFGHLSDLTSLTVARRSDMVGEATTNFCRSLGAGKTPLLQTLHLKTDSSELEGGVGALAEAMRGGGLSLLENFKLHFLQCIDGGVLAQVGLELGAGGCPAIQKLDLRWEEEGDEGVAALAEGLGKGVLSSLRDLSLEVRCGEEGGGEGCIALGEVLSIGKIPSLGTVTLGWDFRSSVRFVCEGISRGRGLCPPLKVDFWLKETGSTANLAEAALAGIIRAGKLSGLRKLFFRHPGGVTGGEALGEALTHPHACVNSLDTIYIANGSVAGLLQGVSRGTGRLPTLRSLACVNTQPIRSEGAQSLSALVRGGRVPSLRGLVLSMQGIGQAGMNAFAAALCSPRVSSLKTLSLGFGGVPPANAAIEIGMFSVAISAGQLRRLENLFVQNLGATEEVRALCVGLGSGELSSLHELAFFEQGAPVGVEAGRALSQVIVAEKLPQLRALTLDSVLDEEGVRALADGWLNRQPPLLRCLSLRKNPLHAAAGKALLKLLGSKRMPFSEALKLGKIDSDGIDERSRACLSGAFPKIVKIDKKRPVRSNMGPQASLSLRLLILT
uniref:Uncharacterized protein n=1 Tax=Chromera velia CCMP2878 TaxID=1169474 RepID=A0A0G4GG41_9ALVE|eukprot:Cvel_21744.t1-p1 / transcript=Cvel_21744.t1 / gene=Cvel_21744 / organism=Chromera_velia_CCMP2878 / gene_product=hypothetical protein / transcript_product=hypothetical protein / location=Cvel_scaffold2066:1746-4136(+) / protein_length=797 / sequence_SO=supercontig / SO=protein_coding / is_pseudo=false